MTRVKLTSYDNYSDYIKYLCQQKGVTITQMCKDIGINHSSFKSNYKRFRLNRKDLLKLKDYLNADLALLMTLPLPSEKKRKDNEIG